MKDVPSVMGGCPPWIGTLLLECKFMFPLVVRKQYFYCTALGVSRAMMYLAGQSAAEGRGDAYNSGERAFRGINIQRQKVGRALCFVQLLGKGVTIWRLRPV